MAMTSLCICTVPSEPWQLDNGICSKLCVRMFCFDYKDLLKYHQTVTSVNLLEEYFLQIINILSFVSNVLLITNRIPRNDAHIFHPSETGLR